MLANPDLLGSIPDWIAGVGALLAVVIAGLAWRTAVRAYRVQQRSLAVQRAELKSLLDDKRQEQADNVAAWVEEKNPWGRPGFPAPSSSTTTTFLVVQNSSSLPVFGVVMRLLWNNPEAKDPSAITRVVVPPGRTEIEVDNSLPSRWATVSILFSDASGVDWIRNGFGQLYEVIESPNRALVAHYHSDGLLPRFPEQASGFRRVGTVREVAEE